MNSPRRGSVAAVSLGVSVLIVAAGWRAAQIIEIGVAYKAKLVCSGDQEPTPVPPAPSPVDSQAQGQAILKIADDGLSLTTS